MSAVINVMYKRFRLVEMCAIFGRHSETSQVRKQYYGIMRWSCVQSSVRNSTHLNKWDSVFVRYRIRIYIFVITVFLDKDAVGKKDETYSRFHYDDIVTRFTIEPMKRKRAAEIKQRADERKKNQNILPDYYNVVVGDCVFIIAARMNSIRSDYSPCICRTSARRFLSIFLYGPSTYEWIKCSSDIFTTSLRYILTS